MQYRREIDGLRALAVMPVLLFHAGFQSFSGFYQLARENKQLINLPPYQAASSFGLLQIIDTIFAFGKFTSFPSINVLPPTIGVVLMVLFARHKLLLANCLAAFKNLAKLSIWC